MAKEVLNEREFELVNIVGGQLGVNQRDISRQLNISLGMTNMLLRRLVTKGCIRIQQLNQRKVQYLLTPKGFSEKMRKSVKYTLKTVGSISLIKQTAQGILLHYYYQGQRNFYIVGKSDFALLIEMIFQEAGIKDYHIAYLEDMPSECAPGVMLICKEDIPARSIEGVVVVDLIHELAKDHVLINRGE